MNVRQIRQKAKTLIYKESLKKQAVYNELVKECDNNNDRKMIADVVRYLPCPERLKKYSVWNNIFGTLLILLTGFLFAYKPSYSLGFLFVLISLVITNQFRHYYWIVLFGGMMLLVTFLAQVSKYTERSLPVLLIMGVLSILFMVAGVYLPKKLTPKYREEKESYVNSDGQTKTKLMHYFE